MSENNKSYRIRTGVGSEFNGDLKLNVNLLQDYETFEILSLKIDTENLYKYHTSKYGCVVGRVLANGGVGVPNVKISAFIPVDAIDASDPVYSYLYPYSSTRDKNRDNIRYNLLTDTKINDCHQVIGTFPNKRLVLDDDNVIEIYDKYYKFTTTTNASGDYMLFGLPTGNNIIHSDLDLSDIGFLSQKPRDLFYKGYTAKQFENASQFKKDTNLDNLTQVISQDSSVYVFPFWGDEKENDGQIKIVRNDIDVNYKFEPTCIFIGCIVSDEKSNAISKRCIPHERMGKMDRLTTGAGTIEMIRKTMSGDIESFSIQGNELIDGNGTWCYQIPMNLDYVATDEYGNLVPTDNFDKGLPTRTSVRFRVSLADYESDYENAHLVKVLVPNNPDLTTENNVDTIKYDYQFGSATKDESFRDMFWNNVYTVKSYIPRYQKGNRQRNKNFTGFKAVNVNGANNPIPYNNMRINLTFLFVFQCLIFKSLIMIVKFLNKLIYVFDKFTSASSEDAIKINGPSLAYITIDGGMCPELEGDYIAPGAQTPNEGSNLLYNTYSAVVGDESIDINGDAGNNGTFKKSTSSGTTRPYDNQSADNKNGNYNADGTSSPTYLNEEEEKEQVKIYNTEGYFVKCVELQFAMEYEVIQFDFYNDWINGMIYIPRWFAEVRKNKDGGVYCGLNFPHFRCITQQCALGYYKSEYNGDPSVRIPSDNSDFQSGCGQGKQICHKKSGRKFAKVYGGLVKRQQNSRGQYAYYLTPSKLTTWVSGKTVKANLFGTDIVLLGSVLDCNQYGIPKVEGYTSSTYMMPPPVAQIIYDTQEMEMDKIGIQKDCNDYIEEAKNIAKPICEAFISGYGDYFGMTDPVKSYIRKAYEDPKNYSSHINSAISLVKAAEGAAIAACWHIPEPISASICTGVVANKAKKTIKALEQLQVTLSENIGGKINKYYVCTAPPTDKTYKKILWSFSKKLPYDSEEEVKSEVAGIDWGYNPFNTLKKDSNGKIIATDDTTIISNQIAGHFLEIGCTFSLSNFKSCVNLQRICELGSEMSQSHYYNKNDENTLLDPSGIIGKREISDAGIRTTFATLNSNRLAIEFDNLVTNGFKYTFKPFAPVSFMGDLRNRSEIRKLRTDYGLIESQSASYKMFRFGTTSEEELRTKFLLYEKRNGNEISYIPQYENSFYFYFGLRDGNTAIDRLYTEYYAHCDSDNVTPNILYNVENDTIVTVGSNNYNFQVIYNTINMTKIRTIIIKDNTGKSITKDSEKVMINQRESTIYLRDEMSYTITMIDMNGTSVTKVVSCSKSLVDPYAEIIDSAPDVEVKLNKSLQSQFDRFYTITYEPKNYTVVSASLEGVDSSVYSVDYDNKKITINKAKFGLANEVTIKFADNVSLRDATIITKKVKLKQTIDPNVRPTKDGGIMTISDTNEVLNNNGI